jgi:hypothetical protein
MDHFFNAEINSRKQNPSKNELLTAPIGTSFESQAFASLYHHREALGISSIWRCRAARLDGYLVTSRGEVILLEMKETLGFGSVQAAVFQFITGRQLLSLSSVRGLIVFRKKSKEWESCRPHGALGQLRLHSDEIPPNVNLKLGGIQIGPENHVIGPTKSAAPL